MSIQNNNLSNLFIRNRINSSTIIYLFIPIIIFFIFSIVGFLSGTANFSPDSWSYFELSKKIFNENFYEFNTWRSYFSDIKSVSFPFGFPILLSIISKIFGEYPRNAIFINILIAIISWFGIITLSQKFQLPKIYQITAAVTLILNPSYLDEVFSGRSIPLALALFVFAFVLIFENKFLAGLFFGISCLTRFDYLIYSFSAILGFIFLKKEKFNFLFYKNLKLIFGFILGLSPWIIFSFVHFGRFWVTDNFWVLASSKKAFVLDYPAFPEENFLNSPLIWISYKLENFFPLLKSIIISYENVPGALLFNFLAIFYIFKKKIKINKILFIVIPLILFSNLIYLFTGYVDLRYFTISILFFNIFALWILSHFEMKRFENKLNFATVILSIILSLIISSKELIKISANGIQSISMINSENRSISKLAQCHNLEPEKTIIFLQKENFINPFKYGAITELSTAVKPSNFDYMSEDSKAEFFEYIKPYSIIEDEDNKYFHCK